MPRLLAHTDKVREGCKTRDELMKKTTLALIFSMALFGAPPPTKHKLSADLEGADLSKNVDVIVQWKETPGEAQHEKVLLRGGKMRSTLQSIKAGAYTLPASQLRDLANEADVAYITPDRRVSSKLDLSAAAINAGAAWSQNFVGTGIAVAVIDSGMVQSPDLTEKNNIVYNEDFTGQIKQNANVTDAHNAPDNYGHGQHVAGIIASSGKSSSCGNCTRVLKGIAPGVSLVNLRALDENGEGSDSAVIARNRKSDRSEEHLPHPGDQSLARAVRYMRATRSTRCAKRWNKHGKPALSWWWRRATMAAITRMASKVTALSHRRETILTSLPWGR